MPDHEAIHDKNAEDGREAKPLMMELESRVLDMLAQGLYYLREELIDCGEDEQAEAEYVTQLMDLLDSLGSPIVSGQVPVYYIETTLKGGQPCRIEIKTTRQAR